jgi:hypothetical protein
MAEAYTPSAPRPAAPGVVTAVRCYCAVLFLIFAFAAVAALWAATAADSPFVMMQRVMQPGASNDPTAAVSGMMSQQMVQGPLLVGGICAGLALLFGIAVFLPPTPGVWVYHVVILCLGLGGWTLPFSVILLILWFKPETQAFFGRGPGGARAP